MIHRYILTCSARAWECARMSPPLLCRASKAKIAVLANLSPTCMSPLCRNNRYNASENNISITVRWEVKAQTIVTQSQSLYSVVYSHYNTSSSKFTTCYRCRCAMHEV